MPGSCHSTYKQFPVALISILVGTSLVECSYYQQPNLPAPQLTVDRVPIKSKKVEIIPVPEKLPHYRLYQNEVSRLEQILAEKDELIRNLNAREQEQAQILQEATSEVSRTQSRLHRLATQPEAASKLAEIEVAMDTLKLAELDESDVGLQFLAQRLLDVAMTAYRKDDYSSAMDHAAQSGEFIDMIVNPAKKILEPQHTTSVLRTPILLFTTRLSNLRANPDRYSKIHEKLAENTALTATAYHNSWFHVRTEDGRSGWIRKSLVDIRANNPDFRK